MLLKQSLPEIVKISIIVKLLTLKSMLLFTSHFKKQNWAIFQAIPSDISLNHIKRKSQGQ
jgi:hypothetical protein